MTNTTIEDYVATRWGNATHRMVVSFEDQQRCETRMRHIWAAVAQITGSRLESPDSINVHTPLGLPAVVKVREERLMVWDAGLGTLCDTLTFPIPREQPAAVRQAIIHRIIAVRCAGSGMMHEASAHLTRADALLDETPIDRYQQIHNDAEAQFDVWLLTEFQERFALGHELAHYIQETDPDSFNEFSAEIARVAARLSDQPRLPTIFDQAYSDLGEYPYLTLADRGIDDWEWYLRGWKQGGVQLNSTSPKHSRPEPSLYTIDEESTCDIIASLAVGLDAHLRGNGWTAIGAVTASRLALANLGTILTIDEWLGIRQKSESDVATQVDIRGQCLAALLPEMMKMLLDDLGGGWAVMVGDAQRILEMVAVEQKTIYGSALQNVIHDTSTVGTTNIVENEVLIRALFLNLRPSADWRYASHAAQEFMLGEVCYSDGIARLLRTTSGFAVDVDSVIHRHHICDWGDIPAEDVESNRRGLYGSQSGGADQQRGALYSSYEIAGVRVFVITRRDRSQTTILLPEEM